MNDFKPEIMYESKGKAPNGDPFISVKKARGYYEYAERPGKDSVAFVLYDKNTGKIGLINESKPPLDERMEKKVQLSTAFGGSIDSEHSYEEIVQIEVREEAGYEVPLDRITEVGSTMVSTQSSQICHLFLVNVTGIEKTTKTETEIQNEGKVEGEFKLNYTAWMAFDEVFENSDWKSIFICAKHGFNQKD